MNVFKICAATLFVTVGLGSIDAALCQNDKTLQANKALVTSALDAFFNKHDASAVGKYVSSTYLQHNPYVQDGPDQLKALVTSLKGSGSSYEIGAVAAEDDLVWTHNRSPAGNASVIVDVFRVKEGKLVEHWDITQAETPASQTASGNPMFPIVPTMPVRAKGCTSSETPCQLKEDLEANKALAAAALDAFFNQKDPSAVDKYTSEPYLNHNPFARNGGEPLKGLISGLAPEITFEMGAQVAENDLVWTNGRYDYGNGVVFIVVDVFRVKDGKLVEHWDISQMEVADTASGRPMFPIVK
uniref:SnoaL-like domain-containing protein n=1 Tax=Globisporangium ultimum (strain ATCC 200006 / CBS 805.95 / DAOM BR144) TaxID=431595 RepID=K3WWA9_GLOUD